MRIAIVTGASSGMGKEFVKQIDKLYKELDEIWVIARRKTQLEQLQVNVRTPLRVFSGDLGEIEIYEKLETTLKEQTPNIRMLVNGAGYGKIGSVEQVSKADKEILPHMIDINCRALTKMTCLCLPYLQEGSRIINLASASGFAPQSNFSVYAATKSYVLSFSRSLQRELKYKKIVVTAVCPGPVNTEFFEVAGQLVHPLKKIMIAEPDKVVKKALEDAKAGKVISIYGLTMKAAYIASKLLPTGLVMQAMEVTNKK